MEGLDLNILISVPLIIIIVSIINHFFFWKFGFEPRDITELGVNNIIRFHIHQHCKLN